MTTAVGEVYEVFIQRRHGEHHVHVGSLLAANAELALLHAKENFLRRDPCVNIWVVARDDIAATSYEDADIFARELNRDYRNPSGYRHHTKKWREYNLEVRPLLDD